MAQIMGHDADPVGAHQPGQRVKLYKIGDGRHKTHRFKMFFFGRLRAGDGTDCGPYYHRKMLPVSPRHNGAEGFSVTAEGPRYEPSLWLRAGFKPFEQIPEDWREVNAKAEAKKAEVEAARRSTPEHQKLMEAMRETMEQNAAAISKVTSAVTELAASRGAGRRKASGDGG